MTHVEIVETRLDEKGIYLKIRTDYGFETWVSFPPNTPEDEIERSLKSMHAVHHPTNQKQLQRLKPGHKVQIPTGPS